MSAEIKVIEFPYPGQFAVCGGGKPVKDCNVAPDLRKGTELPEGNRHRSALQSTAGNGEDFIYPSIQAHFPLGCVACRQMCEAVYEVNNGVRTSERPAVFSMDPETYKRVRAPALENLSRLLLASALAEKKDKVSEQAEADSIQFSSD